MRTILGLVLGCALGAIVVACGSSQKTATPAPVMTDAAGGANPEIIPPSPRDRIEQLDADIAANLARLQVAEPPEWTAMSATDPRPMTEIKSVCTPPARQNQTCGDICNLGTHICDNAEQICTLAEELQPDDWAKGKCEDGKKSCEASRKKCCECL